MHKTHSASEEADGVRAVRLAAGRGSAGSKTALANARALAGARFGPGAIVPPAPGQCPSAAGTGLLLPGAPVHHSDREEQRAAGEVFQ